jgi:hemin uptake protein HemP
MSTSQTDAVTLLTAVAPAVATPQLVFASSALLGKQGICVIEHNAERYMLRRTRGDKLILTK